MNRKNDKDEDNEDPSFIFNFKTMKVEDEETMKIL